MDSKNWISVKDRLPNENESVLVYMEFESLFNKSYRYYILVAERVNNEWVDWKGEEVDENEVKFWMPIVLPEREE